VTAHRFLSRDVEDVDRWLSSVVEALHLKKANERVVGPAEEGSTVTMMCPDGNVAVYTANTDGSSTTVVTHADGSGTTTTELSSHGEVRTTTTAADGTVTAGTNRQPADELGAHLQDGRTVSSMKGSIADSVISTVKRVGQSASRLSPKVMSMGINTKVDGLPPVPFGTLPSPVHLSSVGTADAGRALIAGLLSLDHDPDDDADPDASELPEI
jgi:hypothetical protein